MAQPCCARAGAACGHGFLPLLKQAQSERSWGDHLGLGLDHVPVPVPGLCHDLGRDPDLCCLVLKAPLVLVW